MENIEYTSAEQITISVTIADRVYRLTVNNGEQAYVQQAVDLINKKTKEFSLHYANKDKQDLLAMVALTQTTALVMEQQKVGGIPSALENEIKQINEILDIHFNTYKDVLSDKESI